MRIKNDGESYIALAMYLLVFYLCLPFSMVILNSLLIHAIVFLSAMLFIAGLMLNNKLKELLKLSMLFMILFFYWLITWSVQLQSLTFVYYCFASLVFIFGGMILYNCEDEMLIKRLFLFITVLYFITAITSIVGLSVYPYAARELARGATYDINLDFDTYKSIYRRMNIASWSQIYGMLFAIPVSLMIWKKKKRVFYLIVVIVISILLVASQITFAVLLAILMLALVFLTRENKTKTMVITLILAIAAILIIINLGSIFTYAVNISDKAGLDFLTTKLDDLKVLLLYRNVTGDAGERGLLYRRSLETFLQSPLVGLTLVGKASLSKIGYHSEFFDFLGTFGLVGLFIIMGSVIGYAKFLNKTEKETRNDLYIVYIGFIILFILNPVLNSPQIFVGAFLYPLLASRYCLMGEIKKDTICSNTATHS